MTWIVAVVEPDCLDSEATNVTVYVPGFAYVCAGVCEVLVEPSPKDHAHEFTGPAEQLPAN